ncbi:preprotein translocase subunit SecE [Krasilnikovia sp. M28-CT-15]|uniref:preprotein translocase subunit SecE n=1 Tax=Krasilnikovia sp. M28-CT-15 TaxID=3373540 RepID=UPI003875C3BB
MAERKRPGDDAVGDRPDNEPDDAAIENAGVADDVVEDDEPVGRGGTAVRERTTSAESPKAKKEGRRVGIFGRIGGFFREVVGELRKVIWPTRKELLTYTGVVIAFVAIMTAIVAVLDFGFAKAVLFAFGGKSS